MLPQQIQGCQLLMIKKCNEPKLTDWLNESNSLTDWMSVIDWLTEWADWLNEWNWLTEWVKLTDSVGGLTDGSNEWTWLTDWLKEWTWLTDRMRATVIIPIMGQWTQLVKIEKLLMSYYLIRVAGSPWTACGSLRIHSRNITRTPEPPVSEEGDRRFLRLFFSIYYPELQLTLTKQYATHVDNRMKMLCELSTHSTPYCLRSPEISTKVCTCCSSNCTFTAYFWFNCQSDTRLQCYLRCGWDLNDHEYNIVHFEVSWTVCSEWHFSSLSSLHKKPNNTWY